MARPSCGRDKPFARRALRKVTDSISADRHVEMAPPIALAAHAAIIPPKVSVLFGGELARSYVRQDLQRSSHRHSRNEDDPALFTRHKIGLSDNDRRYVYTMLLDARPSHDISNHHQCAALLTRCDCLHDVLVLGSTLLMLTPCFSHVLHCSNLVERVAR